MPNKLSKAEFARLVMEMPGASEEEIFAAAREREAGVTAAAPEDTRSFIGKAADAVVPTALRIGGAIGGGVLGAAAGLPGIVAGGAAGSGLGETAAEGYEVWRGLREDLNPTQIAVQTALGAVPVVGKAGSMGKTMLNRGLQGAALGGAAAVATPLAEGQSPTLEGALLGAGLGGALGAGGGALEARALRPAAAAGASHISPASADLNGAAAATSQTGARLDGALPPNVAQDFAELNPEAFAAALAENRAASTLTQDAPQRFFQAPNGQRWFYGLNEIEQHPMTGGREIDLTAVMNNDPALRGALDSIMPDAIKRGVTTLDAWAVPSEKYPGGFLPTKYAKYGFEEYGRVPYDLSYGAPDDALKAAWMQDGWKEGDALPDVVYMRHRDNVTKRLGADPDTPAVKPMARDVPPEFHAVEAQGAPPVEGFKPQIGGTKALAIASPAAAAAIPDDPDSKWDDYGRLGLNILGAAGAAGALGAAVRGRQVAHLTPQQEAIHRSAALLWTGGAKAVKEQGHSPKIVQAAKKVIERHLKTTEGEMTNTKKLIAMIRANAADAKWYDKTGEELKTLFGNDAEMMAKFLAATSNNATVASNASLALKALKQFKFGEPFTGYLPVVIDNLNAVVKGEAIGELNGRKVDNFVKALMGDPEAVVVDRWIMRAFGFNKGTAPTDLQYDFMENAIRQMAKQAGVTPRQAQAAIWFAVKNEAEKGKARPASPPMEQAIKESIDRQHVSALKDNRKFDKARKNPSLFDTVQRLNVE